MILIRREQLKQEQNGNLFLNNIRFIVEEAFKTDSEIQIEGEERVYSKGDLDELMSHIQELLNNNRQ